MTLLRVNDRGLQQPNLWIFHSVQVSSPKVVCASNQHAFVHFNVNGITHGISFVYAATTVVERRSLLLSLAHDCSIFAGPHLILGDFNVVFGAHEKIGGILPQRSFCEEFQVMVDTCGLLLVDTKGSPFTWTNGRGISSHIEMLLDRCFCSSSWYDTWPVTSCSTLARHSSDHNPLLVSCQQYVAQFRKPFRFQRVWLDHPNFINFVKEAWGSFQVFWCPMYVLQAKLKLLKPLLKAWNSIVFGNVNTAVDSARNPLESI
ncbi:hypothetical protein TB2_027319 [Malus domestica]